MTPTTPTNVDEAVVAKYPVLPETNFDNLERLEDIHVEQGRLRSPSPGIPIEPPSLAFLEKNYRVSLVSMSLQVFNPAKIHLDEDALVITGQEKKRNGVSYGVNYENSWLAEGKRVVFRLNYSCDKVR